jgi:hypothetical protein
MDTYERDSAFLKSLLPGESLLLRADTLPYMQTGKWNFFRRLGTENRILLLHKSQGYILEVREGDIDWKAYRKTKSQIGIRLQSPAPAPGRR